MSGKEGIRFSQNYISRGAPESDSSRMRLRVYRLFSTLKLYDHVSAETVELGIGARVPYHSVVSSRNWDGFFTGAALRDFLDAITVISRSIPSAYSRSRDQWIEGVGAIFLQENVGYRIDRQGGVHFAVDSEFEHNQASVIGALQAPRYSAARGHFEAGQRALDAHPTQTRDAIRQTFESVETIFKLMFPDVSQLGATEITKKLQPLIEGRLLGTERSAALRWLAGFKEWVNGAHPYRHGQGVETPDNPSIWSAVLSVSLGASYARWLAELDAATLAG